MPIKRSANAGEPLERLLVSENAQHEQLSFDLSLSTQMISHMKTNRRKMQQDIAKESIRLYDNPEYIMDILHTFSDAFTSPVLRGSHIERHRLIIATHLKREMREVLILIEESGLEKPINEMNTNDKEDIKVLMNKLLDARVMNDNFLLQLQNDYKITIKQCLKTMMIRWKALKWLSN